MPCFPNVVADFSAIACVLFILTSHKPSNMPLNKRPKIICHMMSSIDGRLFVDRWTTPAVGIKATTLRGHYDDVASRFESDGWIVGRKTMEEIIQGNAR